MRSQAGGAGGGDVRVVESRASQGEGQTARSQQGEGHTARSQQARLPGGRIKLKR